MKSKLLLLIICLPLFTSDPAWAQTADTIGQLDRLFARYHNEMPGLAVAIARDGKTIYNKAFGLADMEHMVPNTTKTIFECGSVSKQFTAAAILLLIQEGKLSVNDDVRKYIPELPQYEAPITIRHLLSHTSGLKDWGAVYGLTGWPRTTRAYTQELSFDIVFRQKSLNFTPGSQYSYSNSNYVMLVLIIERVSGKSFAEFTTEKLFVPLGMKDTQWRDDFREIVPGRAIAYSGTQTRYRQNMPFEDVHGPGGLLSTTADLLTWNQLLETNELFNKEIAQLRIEPGILNNGNSSGYAAGLMIGKWNQYNEISHSGSTAGYRAWLAWYPEKKISVAILSNYASFDPAGVGRAITAVFLGPRASSPAPGNAAVETERTPRTEPFQLDETKASEYIGTYYSDDADATYKIETRANEVWVYRMAGDIFRLTPSLKDEFTNASNGAFKFTRDKKGKITGFNVSVSRALNVPFKKL